jgi:S1-C subfamily serine protease
VVDTTSRDRHTCRPGRRPGGSLRLEGFDMFGQLLGLALLAPATPAPVEPPPNANGKAFLGIQSEDSLSLVVGAALPGMPAATAGIRPGDRVLRVGSRVPADFQQLSEHVQTYRPGATIAVEVDRNGQRHTFHVRLTTRPPAADSGVPLPFFPND